MGSKSDSRSRRRKAVAAALGMSLSGALAFAVTNWVVGLNEGSSAQAHSGTVASLTITAVATPSATNVLYPGGTGDVVLTISNPNPLPVTITAVDLPTDTTYATGYTTSELATTKTGCLASTPSDVVWNHSSGTSGSSHTLATPLTIAAKGEANNPLTVTFTNAASMTSEAPAACENTFFKMPSFTGIEATAGGGSATTSPATDSWTN
jgi:hypothetical protein